MSEFFDESSKTFALLISILMVITGSINTIAAKYNITFMLKFYIFNFNFRWTDSIVVDGVLFDHSFFQV